VGDEDRVELGEVFVDGSEACGNLPGAEARIDEDASPISSYKCRITGTGRSQGTDLDDRRNSSPPIILFTLIPWGGSLHH
jgi:hypothetical protein